MTDHKLIIGKINELTDNQLISLMRKKCNYFDEKKESQYKLAIKKIKLNVFKYMIKEADNQIKKLKSEQKELIDAAFEVVADLKQYKTAETSLVKLENVLEKYKND